MKNIIIITSLLFLAASCGANKNVSNETSTPIVEEITDNDSDTENTEEDNQPVNSQNGDVLITDGVIRDKSADGCGFIIQMMVDANTESSTFYEPLALPKEYQVEGKLIRIEYRMSRRPSNCKTAFPIIIDQIL